MGNRSFTQVATSDDNEDEALPSRRSNHHSSSYRSKLQHKRKRMKLLDDEEQEQDPEEEEEEEDNNNNKKRSNSKKQKVEEEEPPQEDAKPIGEPIRDSGKGRGRRKHFESFEFDGNLYTLEDPVLLVPKDKDQMPNVAIIKDIAQLPSGSIMVTGQWFYRPEEAERKVGGSWQSRNTRELFYSFHRDEVPAESVMHKCVVHFVPIHKQLPNRKQNPGFIVQKVYDTVEKKLWNLIDKDYEDGKQQEIDELVQKTLLQLQCQNNAVLARHLLNGELEASKILNMTPDELKEGLTAEEISNNEPDESQHIQMTDSRCSRCVEAKVGLRDETPGFCDTVGDETQPPSDHEGRDDDHDADHLDDLQMDDDTTNVASEGRTVIRPVSRGWTPGKPAAAAINRAIRMQFRAPSHSWSSASDETRAYWWARFQDTITWDPVHDAQIRSIFVQRCTKRLTDMMTKARRKGTRPSWIEEEAWEGLLTYWASPEFVQKSGRNRANRASTRGGAVHTSGRKAHVDVALELETQLGRSVDPGDLFLVTHRRNTGHWVDTRSQHTYESYQARLEKVASQAESTPGSQPVDVAQKMQIWRDISGGMTRGRCYGTADLSANVLHQTPTLTHESVALSHHRSRSDNSADGRAARAEAEAVRAREEAALANQRFEEVNRQYAEEKAKATTDFASMTQTMQELLARVSSLEHSSPSASAPSRPPHPGRCDSLFGPGL